MEVGTKNKKSTPIWYTFCLRGLKTVTTFPGRWTRSTGMNWFAKRRSLDHTQVFSIQTGTGVWGLCGGFWRVISMSSYGRYGNTRQTGCRVDSRGPFTSRWLLGFNSVGINYPVEISDPLCVVRLRDLIWWKFFRKKIHTKPFGWSRKRVKSSKSDLITGKWEHENEDMRTLLLPLRRSRRLDTIP